MTFLIKVFRFFLKVLRGEDSIRFRRLYLSKYISNIFNHKVHYGPFKGLVLGRTLWGSTDRASMILGLYEQEILNSIFQVPKKYKFFIDLGAADGYYAIGVLKNRRFSKTFCYEMSEKGRQIIRENAKLNHVENHIEIHGIATKGFYKLIPNINLSHSVMLVDIEGSEFDLFDYECLKAFKKSIIFIELHESLVKNGLNKKDKLIKNAKHFFKVSELTTTARDLSCFEELKDLNDNDRWLICSEGRDKLMTWLRLDPI
jgi:hypothetical protein